MKYQEEITNYFINRNNSGFVVEAAMLWFSQYNQFEQELKRVAIRYPNASHEEQFYETTRYGGIIHMVIDIGHTIMAINMRYMDQLIRFINKRLH